MHYIVDGYNLLFRLLKSQEDISDKRLSLINAFAEFTLKTKLDITIVFDSHYQSSPEERTHVKNLEIIYTEENQTADDYILYLLRHHKNPKSCTVVTSDKRLSWRCRRLIAKTTSVESFLKTISSHVKRRQALQKKSSAPPLKKEPLSKKIISLKKQQNDNELFMYYLKAFEKRLKEIAVDNNAEKATEVETEMGRWLRLFKEKFEKKNGA